MRVKQFRLGEKRQGKYMAQLPLLEFIICWEEFKDEGGSLTDSALSRV